jgi:hypothetical protein
VAPLVGVVHCQKRISAAKQGCWQCRTFVFNHLLGPSSQILAVRVERPLGVVFEAQQAPGHIVVLGFVAGGHAERARKVRGC